MIKVQNLNLRLGDFSLNEINLSIQTGDFFVLLGPTGAGKTVLLEAIAGIRPIKNGRIFLNDRDITNLKPEERNISICYQNYALFPHLSVKENIQYGLRFKKDRCNPKYKKIFEMLIEFLHIEHIINRYPTYLSGGEKQRTALARALIIEPAALLLDEPLSALDASIKESIEMELKNLHQNLKTTIIMVTHDFREAYALATQVGIIRNGNIVQTGSLQEVFQRPASVFAAEFGGMKNLIKIEDIKKNKFIMENPIFNAFLTQKDISYLGIRPENILISNREITTPYSFTGILNKTRNNGIYMEMDINFHGICFKVYLSQNRFYELDLYEGKEIFFGFDSQHLCFI